MNVMDMFRLDGKVALVTGCKTGIGKALALSVAEAGADVIGVSRSLELSGSALEKEVTALGRKFKAYQCDFSNRKALYRFIAQVKKDYPIIDILFSNAGTTAFAPAEDFPDADWDKVMETNLNSQFIISKEIGRDMLKRGKGKIIFTASLASFNATAKSTIYGATKGGIAQLTKALANVWASRGVNVNAIAPGWVDTEMTHWLTDDKTGTAKALEGIPAGRIGTPEDFKGIAVYLASDASDWVHGTVMIIDGGQMIR
jgi:2-dehydro-3-deoxy-D-gluconate 5-dehydrogenase